MLRFGKCRIMLFKELRIVVKFVTYVGLGG